MAEIMNSQVIYSEENNPDNDNWKRGLSYRLNNNAIQQIIKQLCCFSTFFHISHAMYTNDENQQAFPTRYSNASDFLLVLLCFLLKSSACSVISFFAYKSFSSRACSKLNATKAVMIT